MGRPTLIMDLLLCLMLASASILLPTASAQQNCASLTFTVSGRPRTFNLCNSLSALGSSLHWTYNPATGTADIAYRAPQPGSSGWIAWGINPTGTGMVGTQALVAVLSGGSAPSVFTTQVTNRSPSMQQQDLTYAVTGLAVDASGGSITIFATVTLPNNRTTLGHTWQSSTILAGSVPAAHPTNGPNMLSTGTMDFLSGQSSGGSKTILHRRNIHGVLNTVSWGILMPMGAMIARYMRVFESADPAWFYLHITCQVSAYVLGVSGWGLGLKLGADSKGITYGSHRAMGIALFVMATLQVFALFLRPDKKHKYRKFWNIYHHSVGFTVIVLSFFNILKGFKILKPASKYKRAYIGVVIALGAVALTLEVITWIIVINRRRRDRDSGKNQQRT